jgi:hypothetical protein
LAAHETNAAPDPPKEIIVTERDSILSNWCDRDQATAVLSADRPCIEGSTAVRSLILELVLASGGGDELYDACAVLGRLICQRGGSPTLAALTIDHACLALGAGNASWILPARAAVAEGYAMTLVEDATRRAQDGWEFQDCSVPLGEGAVAIAAGHPSDDDEIVAAWAARVANAAARAGIRRAVVAGRDQPRAAVVEALGFVGIEARSV